LPNPEPKSTPPWPPLITYGAPAKGGINKSTTDGVISRFATNDSIATLQHATDHVVSILLPIHTGTSRGAELHETKHHRNAVFGREA
jgi:hypothetical protein